MPALKLPSFFGRLKDRIVMNILNSGSTGLNKLDLRLIEAISPNNTGYFVELGANDGIRQSNTYKLQRDYGWSGLLIEPSPRRFVECVNNRAFANHPDVRCAACVPFGFQERFIEMLDSDLMSVAKGLMVSDDLAIEHADLGSQFLPNSRMRHTYGALALTLSSILDEVSAPANFDLLSLDVEGNELSVLQGLDFNIYKPKWILVEVRSPDVGHYLARKGYHLKATLSDYSSYSDLLFAL